MMTIRLATPYDVEALAAVHAQCFERPWSEREIDALLLDGFGLVGEEAAAILIGRVAGDEAEILTVAVDRAFRRRGWGLALVQAAAVHAAEQGARTLFLEVGVDNGPAIDLYERAGFSVVGRRPAYYHRGDGAVVDALVMRRDLHLA